MLKGMRSLLSTDQMMVFFLVCQIGHSSATYLSGIARKGRTDISRIPRDPAAHILANDSKRLNHWLIGRVVGMKIEHIQEGRENLAVVITVGGAHHFLHFLTVGSPLCFV